jgi:hypothetical protein
MIGQLSNSEFLSRYERTSQFRRGVDLMSRTAWIMYGKSTINYYAQHEDGSWTNYKCKTL